MQFSSSFRPSESRYGTTSQHRREGDSTGLGLPEAALEDLDELSSTLLIPLAARAFGDLLFPAYAAHDLFASQLLSRLGGPVRSQVDQFMRDRPSVFGVLSRTRLFRELAEDFFRRHPTSLGVNLGCGLSCYFQWLDCHTNQWLDADLPQVMHLRQHLLQPGGTRYRQTALDLCQPGWWQRLGLPERVSAKPVLLMCEGVLMYLTAREVEQVLREFAANAPDGSEMLCDTLSWMAIGAAAWHPSVRYTQAQFVWGPRHLRDFTAPDPRLVLNAEYCIMSGYDFMTDWICSSFRAFWGVPLYGLMQLGLRRNKTGAATPLQALVTG